MSEDPFARFERSRGGLLIPIAVFLVGAVLTLVALQTIHQLGLRLSATDPPQQRVNQQLEIDSDDPALSPDP